MAAIKCSISVSNYILFLAHNMWPLIDCNQGEDVTGSYFSDHLHVLFKET